MNHKLHIILYTLASILLVLSIYFTNERIIFLDNALHLIYCINTNELGIMAGRWPIGIVRFPLWISIQLHLPLLILLKVYSVSHILFKLGLLFMLSRFESNKPLLLALLTYLLVLNHSFYWNVSELLPAILFTITVYGFLISKVTSYYRHILILTLFLILAFFSHPLTLLAIGFLAVYLYCSNRLYINYIPLGMIGLLYLIKKYAFPNWYDQMKMEGLEQNFKTYGIDISSIPSFNQLVQWSYSEFSLLSIGLVIAMGALFYQKKIAKALLLVGSTIVTLILIVFSNPEEVPIYYMESSMYLLSFYVGVVVVEDIKLRLPDKLLMPFLYVLITVLLLRVVCTSHYYTNRVEYISEIVDQVKNPKTAILGKNIDSSILSQDWGLPFETLILSKTRPPYKDKTIVTLDERRDYQKYLNEKNVLLNGIGGAYELENLRNYFDLPEELYKMDSISIIKLE